MSSSSSWLFYINITCTPRNVIHVRGKKSGDIQRLKMPDVREITVSFHEYQ